MPVTVIVTRQPVDATQQGYLRSLFASPGFSLLKELVAARCIEKQANSMNAQLYPENDKAAERAAGFAKEAVCFSDSLDVINDLEIEGPENWWTVKLATAR